MTKQKKIAQREEERARDLAQKNAALVAKLEFIEKGYDYNKNV